MIRIMVITGGARGIGRIAAAMALEAGWGVAVWDISVEALTEESEHFREQKDWAGFPCDVSSEKEVLAALRNTIARFGRIDALVNNAAIHANKPLSDLALKEWRRVLEVNLTGPLVCSKFCAPLLRRTRGSIVNLCSTRAFQSEPHTEAYSASKGGIFSLTHALAISLGPEIRVNSVSPGWIAVPPRRKTENEANGVLTEADHAQHPAGRVGEGADIARTILFLCDPANDFITGQNFTIDGGMTRKMIYG